jgi:hypothetical protein
LSKIKVAFVGALMVTLLSGCASTEVAGEPSNTGASKGGSDGSYAGPRSGASLPLAPESEVEWSRYGDSLTEFQEGFGIKNPEPVEVVAWVLPEEQDQYRVPCVADEGFAKEADGSYFTPEDQKSAFFLAQYVCMAKYPVSPQYLVPITDEQLKIAYDWMIATEIPCLEAEGYVISNVPTQDVFVSTYATRPFFPYEQVNELLTSNTEVAALEAKCPQWPATSILFAE